MCCILKKMGGGCIIDKGSSFCFKGDNSIVIIKQNVEKIKLSTLVYNDSLIYIGEKFANNNVTNLIASEARNIILGDECLFSSQVVIRTSDAHRLYSIESMERINPGRSVYIGDHVWFGARVSILKGTIVHSGSVIGSDTLVAGKEVMSNESWGGCPARLLKKKVFFDKKGSHGLRNSDFEAARHPSQFAIDNYIYNKDETTIDISELEDKINAFTDPTEKMNYIIERLGVKNKNRFAQ